MICRNCGAKITYHSRDATWLHSYGRWKGDNGYWCTKEGKTSALPTTGKERMRDTPKNCSTCLHSLEQLEPNKVWCLLWNEKKNRRDSCRGWK